MNPLDALFQRLRAEKRAALMPFLTAGDPDLAFTQQLLPRMAAAGADLFEIGFPFSDPIADGPVIQASYTRALRHGLKLADIFRSLHEVHQTWKAKPTPLVAMASYSLIYRMGATAFIEAAQNAGLCGAVLPDLPVEEANEFASVAQERNFHPILLVTPTTSPARAEKVVKVCRGFVYVVSVVGITGTREALPAALREQIARLRTLTDLPLCVGFGVSTPDHVRELQTIADGVIVGSALVKHLENASSDRTAALTAVCQLVKELRAALG
ncbi:MAG: tryptophan synthase subunit alpha [Gemmataceae bacterium]|nr:tryptophan synthase subunit alpha [Gemmata sp.]MDW8196027.1 tryptophan synthase subunit alpha [Gemmataceae bacterium]